MDNTTINPDAVERAYRTLAASISDSDFYRSLKVKRGTGRASAKSDAPMSPPSGRVGTSRVSRTKQA